VAAADLDGDGHCDVVLVTARGRVQYGNLESSNPGYSELSDGEARVSLNSTQSPQLWPTFSGAVSCPVGFAPSSVAVGDLDGDARLDFVAANSGIDANDLSIVLQDPARAGRFFSEIREGVWTPFKVLIDDLNADGLPDLIISGLSFVKHPIWLFPISSAIEVIFQDPASPGTFQMPTMIFTSGPFFLGVATGDLDGDGYVDLVVSGAEAFGGASTTTLLRQDPTAPGTFAVTGSLETDPLDIEQVADLNGDGAADLVLAGSGLIEIRMQDAANPWSFFAPTDIEVAATDSGQRTVAVADIDGDALPDLLVLNNHSAAELDAANNTVVTKIDTTITLLLQNAASPGSFQKWSDTVLDEDSASLAVGDFNLDGWLDLVTVPFGPDVKAFTILVQDPAHTGTFIRD